MGAQSGGNGLAVIRGSRTRWHASGLRIGSSNSGGWLRIEDGATVSIHFYVKGTSIGRRGRLTLAGGTLQSIRNDVFNEGLIEGSGSIDAGVTVGDTGRISVGAGERLSVQGALNSFGAASRIEIGGGELAVAGTLSTGPSTTVVANAGVLRYSNFNNRGNVSFVDDGNRIYGRTINRGAILAARHSQVAFYNDVHNDAAIHADDGAEITFFGRLSGNGVTGDGRVYLEGPVAPGAAGGTMAFGGDVTLGELSRLEMEIAGDSPRQHVRRARRAGHDRPGRRARPRGGRTHHHRNDGRNRPRRRDHRPVR